MGMGSPCFGRGEADQSLLGKWLHWPRDLCPPCWVYGFSTAPRGGGSFQGSAELKSLGEELPGWLWGCTHSLQLTHQCFQFLIKCTAGKLMLKPLGLGFSN